MVHAADRGMLGEETGDPKRARGLVAEADPQRLQPAMEQEAGMRIERSSQVIERVFHRLDPAGASGYGACDQIAMPVEVLRRAVEDEVEAQRDRPETERRGEGVVDEGDQVVRPGEARRSLEVADVEERVRQRLHVDRPRVRAQVLLPGRDRVAVDEGGLDSQPDEVAGEEVVGAAIERLVGGGGGGAPEGLVGGGGGGPPDFSTLRSAVEIAAMPLAATSAVSLPSSAA